MLKVRLSFFFFFFFFGGGGDNLYNDLSFKVIYFFEDPYNVLQMSETTLKGEFRTIFIIQFHN